jgi:hypothetical protein
MKAGKWVFLTGIEAVDYRAGLHPAVRGDPALPHHGLPKHRREGDFICARLSELLEESGTSFANTVQRRRYGAVQLLRQHALSGTLHLRRLIWDAFRVDQT